MEIDEVVEGRQLPREEGEEEEEEEMEEGEISSDGDEPNLRESRSDFERRPKGDLGLEITISNKNQLPDLLKEIGNSGVDVFDRECSERMEARARRFNLKSNAANFEEIENLYSSLGIPADEVSKSRSDRNYRLETIHVYIQKSNRNVQSKDIYEYFKEFNPVSFEWITSHSINVIWALPTSASKAMLQMSRPLKEPADAMEINVRNSSIELISDGMDLSLIKNKFGEPCDSPIYTNEIGGSIVIPEGVWRFGKPCDFSSFIFMQFASKNDKLRNDNRRSNHSLIKQEGIISSSLKRKMREAMIHEQEMLLQEEQRKKYLGPVGKNPWGSIAESWSDSNSKRTISVPRDIILPSRIRDWDAPDKGEENERFRNNPNERYSKKRNFEDADIYSPRKRMSEDVCEPEFTTYESNEGLSDDEWKSKLKKPRMTMIADQVESKVSAKTRLYKGIKRRFKNDERIDIRILEIEDSSPPRINPKDLRERLTLSIDTADFNRYKDKESTHKKTLTDRFNSGYASSHIGSSLRDRLGERKASYSDINDSPDNDSDPNFIDRDSKYNKRNVTRRNDSDSDISPIQRDVSSTVVKVKREKDDARHKIDDKKKLLLNARENVHEKRSRRSSPVNKKTSNIAREKKSFKHLDERDISSNKKSQRKAVTKGRRSESTSSESSDSSESDSSSSDSSSESDSSESSSSSSSSYSSSSTSSEDNYVNKSHSKSKGTTSRMAETKARKKSQLSKTAARRSKEDSKKSSNKSTGGLRDKLKEYLKQAKERKKPK